VRGLIVHRGGGGSAFCANVCEDIAKAIASTRPSGRITI
jgi:hypothetical protein